MPISTRELFARLIKCEAGGEGETGMKAVANVIMNRVFVTGGQYLREYEGDLRRVMEAPWEFTCMMTIVGGEANPQTVWSSEPEQIHYDIADWALSGHKLQGVAECLWYYNPFAPDCAKYFPSNGNGVIFNRINQHCFYTPTASYFET